MNIRTTLPPCKNFLQPALSTPSIYPCNDKKVGKRNQKSQTQTGIQPHLASLRTPRPSQRARTNELTALVSLIRRVVGIDNKITPFAHIVRKNFQKWTFEHNARADKKLTEEQMAWLAMIKRTYHHFIFDKKAMTLNSPFNQHGGLGQAYEYCFLWHCK